MRVVFDTNVLVSAALKPGSLPDIALAICRQGSVAQSVTSPFILDEFRRVLSIKLRTAPASVETSLRAIRKHSEVVFPVDTLDTIHADPTDNRILECAVEGRADAIVSGDRHLLALKRFRKIPILTVREFVNTLHR